MDKDFSMKMFFSYRNVHVSYFFRTSPSAEKKLHQQNAKWLEFPVDTWLKKCFEMSSWLAKKELQHM